MYTQNNCCLIHNKKMSMYTQITAAIPNKEMNMYTQSTAAIPNKEMSMYTQSNCCSIIPNDNQ